LAAAGACGGGGDDPEADGDDPSSETTTTAAADGDPDTSTGAASGVDGDPAALQAVPREAPPPGTPVPARPTGSAQAVASGDQEAFRPPAGTYRYNVDQAGHTGSATLRVDALGNAEGGFRQRHRFDESGAGLVRDLLWTGAGVAVERQQNVRGAENGTECRWQPAFFEYKFPLDVGASWKLDSVCTPTGGPGSTPLRQQGEARVVGTKTVKVAGVDVAVVEVKRTTSTSLATGAVGVVSERETTEQWSPRYGLLVAVDGVGRTRVPGQKPSDRPFRYLLLDLKGTP
jgi:hypothetical protein